MGEESREHRARPGHHEEAPPGDPPGAAEVPREQHGVHEPGIELIQKPFTADELLTRVRQVLDRKDDLGEG